MTSNSRPDLVGTQLDFVPSGALGPKWTSTEPSGLAYRSGVLEARLGRSASRMIDQGLGGRHAILPPGYGAPPPDGFIPLRSETKAGFTLLRSNLKSGTDVDAAAAVAYGKRVGLYRLDAAGNQPPTRFVEWPACQIRRLFAIDLISDR